MVKLLKFVTGEDVVATSKKENDVYFLEKPFVLVATREGLGLMPLSPLAKSEIFEIKASHIVWEAEPEDEIKTAYANSTGSVVIPTPSLIV